MARRYTNQNRNGAYPRTTPARTCPTRSIRSAGTQVESRKTNTIASRADSSYQYTALARSKGRDCASLQLRTCQPSYRPSQFADIADAHGQSSSVFRESSFRLAMSFAFSHSSVPLSLVAFHPSVYKYILLSFSLNFQLFHLSHLLLPLYRIKYSVSSILTHF